MLFSFQNRLIPTMIRVYFNFFFLRICNKALEPLNYVCILKVKLRTNVWLIMMFKNNKFVHLLIIIILIS